MLQVIDIEGSGALAIFNALIAKLSLGEHPEIVSEGSTLEVRQQLSVHLWDRQRVIIISGNSLQGKLAGTAPAALRMLRLMLNTNVLRDVQVWIALRLTESQLREIRSLEEEGLLTFHCLMLEENHIEKDPTKVNRLLKISQNGKLGARWVSGQTTLELLSLLDLLLQRDYAALDALEQPKYTNGPGGYGETSLSKMMRAYYSQVKQREIRWFPKLYVQKMMDEEAWGVKPLPASTPRVERLVLCTGTGRSGTTWFSKAMSLIGLDVRHQANGVHGCSGAEFAIDADWYPWFPVYGGGDCANVGERRSDYHYAHVLHGVRHPLWCIPSLQKNYAAINAEFWAQHGVMPLEFMDATGVQRNAAMYYHINRVIDESHQAEYRFQIEQVEQEWPTLMEILGLQGTPWPQLGKVNYATSWGQYEPYTWTELEQLVGASLCKAIKAQAASYGYE